MPGPGRGGMVADRAVTSARMVTARAFVPATADRATGARPHRSSGPSRPDPEQQQFCDQWVRRGAASAWYQNERVAPLT
jgi:hypothetical protein